MSYKILILGDICGKPGRQVVAKYLDQNKDKYDLIIANIENAASGFGISKSVYEKLNSLGIHVFTSGNHIWDRKEVFEVINKENLLRPLNYVKSPGKGYFFSKINGKKIFVANVLGKVFMDVPVNPFLVLEDVLKLKEFQEADIKLIDIHAEATSEKEALAYFLSGKFDVIYGTHTHVQTNDIKIINKSIYISDVGKCGAYHSVIGMSIYAAIYRLSTSMPVRFTVPEKENVLILNGLEVEFDTKVVGYNLLNLVYLKNEDVFMTSDEYNKKILEGKLVWKK